MENHELRLRINAAAARSGGRDFVRAIDAIKAAVRNLERDTDGVFKRLKKSFDDAAKSSKVKIQGVDKAAIRNIQDYARFMREAAQATAGSSRSIGNTARSLRNATEAYGAAKTVVDALNKSLQETNTKLARQIQLANQARSAMTQVRTAPEPAATTRRGGSTGRESDAQARATAAANRETERLIALQNRAQRVLDNSKLMVERLTIALAKVGAGASIRDVIRAYENLQGSLSGTVRSTGQIDAATTRFNSTLKTAQTSLTTLVAKQKEEEAAVKNAARLMREQANATNELAKAKRALATATERLAASENAAQRLQLASASAMRQAEQEAARLIARLRGLGDTKGVNDISQALIRMRATIASGVGSTLALRQAMNDFQNVAGRAKVNITQVSAAQAAAAQNARMMATAEADATRQARMLEREIRSTAAASQAASRAFRDATGNLRGLENAFSASFQAGSALRALLGSLTLGTFTRGVFQAGDALDQFRVTMEVATDNAMEAGAQFDFVEGLARNFGTGLRGTRQEFSKFAVSSDIAGVSMETTQKIFGSVAKALAVLGRGTEDQRLAFLALEQMMSKGTISSEELRRQLGERLPGAVNLMAEAAGVSTSELQKMLKAGELLAVDVLPKFADVLNNRFGPGIDKALARAGTQFRIFQTEVEKALESIAQEGFMQELAGQFRDLVNLMRGPAFAQASKQLGMAFADAAKIFGVAAKFILENINEIGELAKAVFIGILARQAVLVARSFLLMGANVVAFATTLTGVKTAQDLNTISITENSVAVTALSRQLAVLNAERGLVTGAATRHTAALTANTGAALANSAAIAGVSKGVATSAAGLGKMGTGLTVFARGLGAISGPIGLVVTGLSLLPLLFDDTASAATNAASGYEDAVSRMRSANAVLLSSADPVLKATPLQAALRNANEYEASIRKAQETARQFASTQSLDLLGGLEDTTKSAAVKGIIEEYKSLAEAFVAAASRGEISAKVLAEFLSESAKVQGVLTTSTGQEQFRAFGKEMDSLIVALTTVTGLQEEFTTFEIPVKNVAEAQREVANLSSTIQDAQEAAFNMANEIKNALGSEGLSGLTGGIVAPILQASKAFDGTEASVNNYRMAIDGARERVAALSGITESTRNRLNGFLDEMEANVKVAGELEKSVAAASNKVDAFGNALNNASGDAATFAAAMQGVEAAIEKVNEAKGSIEAAGKNAVAELEKEIRIAGLSERERAIEETLDSVLREDAKFQEALALLLTARTELAGSMVADGARESLRGAIASAEAIIAETTDRVRTLAGKKYDTEETNKPTRKGRGGRSSAERETDRQEKALQKLAEQSSTTAAALFELKEAEELLAGSVAMATFTEKERAQLMLEAQKRAVEEIASNEGVGASFQNLNDLLEENTAQTQANQIIRAANVALVREGQEAIEGEAAARIRDAIAAERQRKAIAEAKEATREYIVGLREEAEVMKAVISGKFYNADVAERVIEMTRAGIAVNDQFIDSLNRMALANDKLSREMRNPAKEWLASVPSFRESAQQIEADVFQSMSDALVEFAETGKFSFDDFITSMINSATRVVANGAIKELLSLFGMGEEGFGFGKIADALGGSIADPKAPDATGAAATAQSIVSAHTQGGDVLVSKLNQSSMDGSQQFSAQIIQGSQQGAQAIGSAITAALQSAPAGIGGGSGTDFSGLLGGSSAAPTTSPLPPSRPGQAGSAAGALSSAVASGGAEASKSIGAVFNEQGGTFADKLSGIFSDGASGFSSVFAGLGGLIGGAIGGPAGGAIGGILGTVLPLALDAFGFEKGGLTSAPTAINTGFVFPVSAFHNAPSFAQGTANTSGMPAILHDNEAVIPLTGNRKVPVEMDMGDGFGGRQTVVNQTFNFPNSDADSFRRSRSQTAASAALIANQAVRKQT